MLKIRNKLERGRSLLGLAKKLVNFGPLTKKLQAQMLTHLSSKFGMISGNFKV